MYSKLSKTYTYNSSPPYYPCPGPHYQCGEDGISPESCRNRDCCYDTHTQKCTNNTPCCPRQTKTSNDCCLAEDCTLGTCIKNCHNFYPNMSLSDCVTKHCLTCPGIEKKYSCKCGVCTQDQKGTFSESSCNNSCQVSNPFCQVKDCNSDDNMCLTWNRMVNLPVGAIRSDVCMGKLPGKSPNTICNNKTILFGDPDNPGRSGTIQCSQIHNIQKSYPNVGTCLTDAVNEAFPKCCNF